MKIIALNSMITVVLCKVLSYQRNLQYWSVQTDVRDQNVYSSSVCQFRPSYIKLWAVSSTDTQSTNCIFSVYSHAVGIPRFLCRLSSPLNSYFRVISHWFQQSPIRKYFFLTQGYGYGGLVNNNISLLTVIMVYNI